LEAVPNEEELGQAVGVPGRLVVAAKWIINA